MKIDRFDVWWNSKLKAYRRRNVFHKFFKFCSWDNLQMEILRGWILKRNEKGILHILHLTQLT